MSKCSKQSKKIFGEKTHKAIVKPAFRVGVAAAISTVCPLLAPLAFLF